MNSRSPFRNTARKVAYLTGFGAAAVIGVSAPVTGVVYRGEAGERYSFFKHYISELGELGVSELAPLFNLGLIVGGLLLAIFMVALAVYVRMWVMAVIAAAGLVAAVGLAFVGVLPVGVGQSLERHTLAAATFFLAGLLFTSLFTFFVQFSRRSPFPRWLAIPSVIAALSFFTFLFLPRVILPGLGIEQHFTGLGGNRPGFWLPPFLEWLILFAMTSWMLIVSGFLCCRASTRSRHARPL